MPPPPRTSSKPSTKAKPRTRRSHSTILSKCSPDAGAVRQSGGIALATRSTASTWCSGQPDLACQTILRELWDKCGIRASGATTISKHQNSIPRATARSIPMTTMKDKVSTVGNIYYGRHGKNLAKVAPSANSQRSRCLEPILELGPFCRRHALLLNALAFQNFLR